MYYAAIDVTTECIRTIFNQKDFKVYQSIQDAYICWFQDTEIVGFLFFNWRCKCYTPNVHWFAETVYKLNNSRCA